MITPGATSILAMIAHEPLDPADDARGEQHFVPDLDLLADLQLALSALAPRPDQEHVADREQQNDEDQRERAAGLLGCGSQKCDREGRHSVDAGKGEDLDKKHARPTTQGMMRRVTLLFRPRLFRASIFVELWGEQRILDRTAGISTRRYRRGVIWVTNRQGAQQLSGDLKAKMVLGTR
jgi:hypothetical protein